LMLWREGGIDVKSRLGISRDTTESKIIGWKEKAGWAFFPSQEGGKRGV